VLRTDTLPVLTPVAKATSCTDQAKGQILRAFLFFRTLCFTLILSLVSDFHLPLSIARDLTLICSTALHTRTRTHTHTHTHTHTRAPSRTLTRPHPRTRTHTHNHTQHFTHAHTHTHTQTHSA